MLSVVVGSNDGGIAVLGHTQRLAQKQYSFTTLMWVGPQATFIGDPMDEQPTKLQKKYD
jgi:hypothetical protein